MRLSGGARETPFSARLANFSAQDDRSFSRGVDHPPAALHIEGNTLAREP